MTRPDLFIEWYDRLFASKDYQREIACVVSLIERWGPEASSRVLEVGVGTGNHTLALARRGYRVVGIDIDPVVIAVAESKLSAANLPNVKLRCSAVQDLQDGGFDFSVALFNVANYLESWTDMTDVFGGVADRLVAGGIFVFDCWNGVAALRDPPVAKETRVTDDGDTMSCQVSADTDLLAQRTRLQYRLTLTGARNGHGTHSLIQALWTPQQIRNALDSVGLEVIGCFKVFEPEVLATAEHREIMFVCGKPA